MHHRDLPLEDPHHVPPPVLLARVLLVPDLLNKKTYITAMDLKKDDRVVITQKKNEDGYDYLDIAVLPAKAPSQNRSPRRQYRSRAPNSSNLRSRIPPF